MIEKLEFEILHLKADRQPEDPSLPIRYSSTNEHSNPRSAASRIDQALNPSQSVLRNSQNRPSKKLTQRLSQSKHGSKTGLQSNEEKSRNVGGLLFTCDASPHSP